MNDLQSFVRDNWKTILCEANSRLDKVNFRLSSVLIYEQIVPYKSIPISLSILYVGGLQTNYLLYKSHQRVTNIMILPPTSSNCYHHKVTNIAYNITVAQYLATGSKKYFSTIEQQLYLDHW